MPEFALFTLSAVEGNLSKGERSKGRTVESAGRQKPETRYGTREERCAYRSAIFVAAVETGSPRQLPLPVEAGSPRQLTASSMAGLTNPLQSAVAKNASVSAAECAVTKQRT